MTPNQPADASTEQILFLSKLAEGLPPGFHFQVAKLSDRGTFPAEVWHEQYLDGPWYFSTGASNHPRSRKHENMVAVRAIVLDDVGTKVDPAIGTKVDRAKVLAAPTWELETSPGNFQLGFMLKTWEKDIGKADDLVAGLITAGLQDKGVNRACRLFRMPDSVNVKPGRDNFRSRLHSFDSDIVYTLNTLVKALKIVPGTAAQRIKDTGERPKAGVEDPLFKWLDDRGMVRHPTSGGWWEIECPFGDEHTDGRDEAKFLPMADSHTGRSQVECHHGHGDDKSVYRKRFLAWATEQGAPGLGPDPERIREMFQALRGTVPPVEPARDTSSGYTFTTLGEDLGGIDPKVLPDYRAKGEGIPAATQRNTVRNVEAALAYMGVQPRLNLMTGGTSYVLPERIDIARFGAMTHHERDRLVTGAVRDAFDHVGIPGRAQLDDNLAVIAASRYWHPAKDWIESKPWDGQDRLGALLASVATPTPDLFKVYFRRWALQTIEAACGWEVRREEQKSLCLVLAGAQGIGKTRWLKALAPGYAVEGKHLNLDGGSARDSKHEALQGMIVELGELDTTFKKTAVGSLKAFLSQMVDEYRLPYSREWLKRPRCTSFCASVNDDEFLQDTTGNRRFATLWVDRCNPMHGVNMQQFWAQVHSWWKAGEQWWLTDAEMAQQIEHNEKFQSPDGIVDMLNAQVEKREADPERYCIECSVLAADIAQLLGLRAEDRAIGRRVADALRQVVGHKQNLRKRGGGPKAWKFMLDSIEARDFGVALKPAVE